MKLRFRVDKIIRVFEKKLKPFNRIEISRGKMLGNYRSFVKMGKKMEFWPVMKANAYGCGIEQITEILDGVNFEYWVADSLVEAQKIWEKSSKRVLLIGPIQKENYKYIDFRKITLSVQSKEDLEVLGGLNKDIKIHLKVNTGMNRQGFEIEEIKEVVKVLEKYPRIEVEGVFSHLAQAESDILVERQEEKFKKAIDLLELYGIKPRWVHLAASAGAFRTKDSRINAVRLGIGLYEGGVRLVSTIVKARWVREGERVGYGGTYTMKEDGWLGVIPVGYYEALDRGLSNRGQVKYKDRYYPLAGNICMNMITVNFGRTEITEGEEVEVIGAEGKNSFKEMAQVCGTVDYELMVRLNASVRREIVD
ncbi:MAG: alanine racemase [Candidatus Shapirobacteria bacterium]|jgi:alanine racemase